MAAEAEYYSYSDELPDRLCPIRSWDPTGDDGYSLPVVQPRKFPSILIAAARSEGKTTLVRYLYEQVIQKSGAHSRFAYTWVFSNADATLRAYSEFVKPAYLEDSPDEDAQPINFVNFAERGEEVLANLVRAQGEAGPAAPRTLVILDDVIGRDLRVSDLVQQLYTQGRHSRIAVILVVQAWSTSVPTAIRKNADIIALARLRSGTEAKMIRNEVLKGCFSDSCPGRTVLPSGAVPKSAEALSCALLTEGTQNYGFVIIDHRRHSKIEAGELIHFFRVPKRFVVE
jgi:hypothetical protein